MKKYRWSFSACMALLCLCTGLFAGPAYAQSCVAADGTMLWKVEMPSMAEQGISLYLFGSIHVGKPDFYPLADSVERLFRSADHLVFEVDPSTAADPAVALRM
jgi:uncharacterized protein YbaP (TraB family)